MTSNAYSSRKQARRQTQAQHLETVRQLPIRSQAAALFGLWPERLPRLVRRQIDKTTLAGWRALRSQAHDQRWEAFDEMLDAQIQLDEQAQIRALLETEHGAAAFQIQALVGSLSNLKSLVITAGEQAMTLDVAGGEDVEDDALYAIMLALHLGGSVVARQNLALRTQVKNAQGKMEWVHQERIYGIVCEDGQWTAMSEAQMRNAYCHDAQGNPLARDPVTSFGTLKALVRTQQRSRPH